MKLGVIAILIGFVLSFAQKPSYLKSRTSKSRPNQVRTISDLTHKSQIPTEVYKQWNDTLLQIHFKETPIREVTQALSQSYGLNILVQDSVDAKISLNLDKIGLVDGLIAMVKVHHLQLLWEDGVFYIRPQEESSHQRIGVVKRLAPMDLDVSNQEVKSFIKDFAKQTGIQVLASKSLEGKVTGFWKQQDPLSAFRSLMEAHGYQVKRSGEFWIVFAAHEGANDSNKRKSKRSRTSGVMEVVYSKDLLSLNLQDANLKDVLREIGEQAGLNMIFYGEINDRINARIEKASIHETFASLLRGTRFTYQIAEDGIILVGLKDPKSPSGNILTTYEIFPLRHIKADEAIKALPKSISKGSLIVVKEQNAVLITGTLAEIQNIQDYLNLIDAPTPQVSLECIIVEYTRGDNMEYGVKLADAENTSTLASPEIGIRAETPGGQWSQTTNELRTGVGILPNDFLMRLTALENENKAKVLAMPRITTLNGNQASIQVTNTSYFQISAVSKDGLPVNDYKPIDDGITLDITPFITQAGEITMDIKPEIKTSSQSSSEGPSNIATRKLQTTVQLGDGETIMLGGLIQSNQSRVREGIPVLGSIPLIGYLFSYYKDLESTTELVIFVTPRVLKNENLDVKKALDDLEQRELEGDLSERYEQSKFSIENKASAIQIDAPQVIQSSDTTLVEPVTP